MPDLSGRTEKRKVFAAAMKCVLCPRMCGADRGETEGKGYCGMGLLPVVARIAPHMWEEPCISGTRGSGTVFFSGCPLGCVYCQNHMISHGRRGKTVTIQELAEHIKVLEKTGVHNISFVTGTHFIPSILGALNLYMPRVPLVWNSGGYERTETLKLLKGAIGIYLPDLKHVSPRLGKVLCSAADYFEKASQAVLEMIDQTGSPVYSEEGIILTGTVIRHLVLPGCTGDSIRVLDWIHQNTPPETPVSIMRQYTPVQQCHVKGLERKITDDEYDRVTEYAMQLGLNAFVQEKDSAAEAYIPDFDMA